MIDYTHYRFDFKHSCEEFMQSNDLFKTHTIHWDGIGWRIYPCEGGSAPTKWMTPFEAAQQYVRKS